MTAYSPALAERLEEIRGRIAAAAGRSRRSPSEIVLVGAVKSVPLARVEEALAAGLTDLGENRVQEAAEAARVLSPHAARWHMIGHLQRNKVKRAVEIFDRVHSIDGEPLARELALGAATLGRTIAVLVQVNVAEEATKFGVRPEGLAPLVERVARLPGLALDGLMTIGPPVREPEEARSCFARTRALRDEVEHSTGVRLPHLSMGMSGDFEVAVEEGSTLVRVGTALFGPRAA